ncbi:hypothetical protein BDZ91DRAFT_742411, partial [Kalaharituber pfeilii]
PRFIQPRLKPRLTLSRLQSSLFNPEKGERYGLNPSAAKTRLQAYAFSQGFLISVASGSEQCGRIRYRCVHYGDAPRDRYTEYKASDGMSKTDPGKKLRQRQALVSQL